MTIVIKQTKEERADQRERAQVKADNELARIASMADIAAQAAKAHNVEETAPDEYDLWCASYADQGVTGLALLTKALRNVVDHRNSTGLCKLVGRGTKDMQVNARIRSLTGRAIGGIAIKVDKTHFTGIRVLYTDNYGPTELLGQLERLVEHGGSLFGKDVSKMLAGEKKKRPIEEMTDLIAARILKLCKDEKVSVETFLRQNLAKAINLAL